ncbi:hypothetical protein BCR42DRAFT_419202 [Absidia repens]|uniref:Uncharacterized protein n=1 Tax=Absidia repens TaxID=90262 RepID=A0A1X2IB06_9FUNG|nr:hypothetical protein BCR42DRAFT_419202 [Absidia repens]
MRTSFSSLATSMPSGGRHSFSHFIPQLTPARPGQSHERQRQTSSSVSTIASIEERLAAIEGILRTLLESSVNHSPIVNKGVVEKGLTTNADGRKGVAHHPYLSGSKHNNNSFSLPPSAAGSTDIAHDYLRLPPLYNNNNNNNNGQTSSNPSTAAIIATTTTSASSPSSSSPPSSSASAASVTSASPPPSSAVPGSFERTGSYTNSTQQIDRHGNAETSTLSLPPMVTGFKRPHDSTTGQVSTTHQPIYVTTTPLDHAVQHTTDHRPSSAEIDTPSSTTTIATATAHNSYYTSQHPILSTIPL